MRGEATSSAPPASRARSTQGGAWQSPVSSVRSRSGVTPLSPPSPPPHPPPPTPYPPSLASLPARPASPPPPPGAGPHHAVGGVGGRYAALRRRRQHRVGGGGRAAGGGGGGGGVRLGEGQDGRLARARPRPHEVPQQPVVDVLLRHTHARARAHTHTHTHHTLRRPAPFGCQLVRVAGARDRRAGRISRAAERGCGAGSAEGGSCVCVRACR